MRGKDDFLWWQNVDNGITPAYAGKSERGCQNERKKRDHPRLCGEKVLGLSMATVSRGSPPPMRGKAHKASMTLHRSGITPAYAGKSQACSLSHKRIEDHPRLCGEKHSRSRYSGQLRGSPPPMRGKVEKCDDLSDVRGITPAYAGKSRRRLFRGKRCEDHPRLCGEKTYQNEDSGNNVGSPPPMRGKGLTAGSPLVNDRITPAYAGKSFRLYFLAILYGDHPRLCGEKF